MPITRTAQIDDDGTGTTGTIYNNAWKQEFYNQIDAYVTPATAYGVTWTSTGTFPALGNGALEGTYIKLGSLIYVNIYLLYGSTTTSGTGGWLLSLPVPIYSGRSVLAFGNTQIGVAFTVHGAYTVSATSLNPFAGPTAASAVGMDATHPGVWGNGSWLDYHVFYRWQ